MARPQVPAFGDWGSEEVPYTMYFDNARKGKKSGQQIDAQNHTEPESTVQKPSDPITPKQSTKSEEAEASNLPQEAILKQKHNRRASREEGDMRRLTDSPLRNSPHHHRQAGGETPRRVSRQGVGDRSVEQSPHHPHSQARVGGRNSGVSSSPSWERKPGVSEGSHGQAPLTPGRSRLRSVTRGDDSPDRGPAVPKFGEWDETDPAAAEGYTHIFNKVREEKHNETGKVPVVPTETSYTNSQKQYANDDAKGCCCFAWAKR